LGYTYNDIPTLYYKYDEESNEEIHGLTKKLHVFVDHEPDEPVELALIEAVQPMSLLS
jgi:hypothetical protein